MGRFGSQVSDLAGSDGHARDFFMTSRMFLARGNARGGEFQGTAGGRRTSSHCISMGNSRIATFFFGEEEFQQMKDGACFNQSESWVCGGS